MSSKQKKAYSYIRFSSKVQSKGQSLDRQLKSAKDYCHDNSLDLDSSSFLDLGVSAYKGDHLSGDSGLGKFFAACSLGKIRAGDYLLVESLDRISRQPTQTAMRQFLNILDYGINIVTLMDQKIYTKDSETTDLIISLTIMARAFEESDTKSKRIKDTWNKKRELLQKGTDTHKTTSLAPHWLTLSKDRTTWIEDPDKVAVIRDIYDKASQGFGQRKLVQYLNSNNIPSARGKGWAESSIKRVLTDKNVIGHYQPHEYIDSDQGRIRVPVGGVITDYYMPIISEDLYYQVQAQRADRRVKGSGSKGVQFSNLLQGIVRCDLCGSAMHQVNKGKTPKGGKYLVCSKARNAKGCKYTSFRYNDIEQSVIIKLLRVRNHQKLSGDSKDIDSLKAQIQVTEGKLQDAVNSLKQFLDVSPDFTIHAIHEHFLTLQEAVQVRKKTLENLKEDKANQTSKTGANWDEVFQLIADVLDLEQAGFCTPKDLTSDERYSLRVKLNGIIADVFNIIKIRKSEDTKNILFKTGYVNWKDEVGHAIPGTSLWLYNVWTPDEHKANSLALGFH